MPDFTLESIISRKGYSRIAGVDEVGRGSWAGPVVAAAVVICKKRWPCFIKIGLNDSKKLSPKRREELFNIIQNNADIGIGLASVKEIDRINILQATFLAMDRALGNLSIAPNYCLIDGDKVPLIECEAEAILKGDERSNSIAAASIIAKVTRDKLMIKLGRKFPGYSWEYNMGYGTKKHKEGLEKFGVTKYHRKSYKPIINILG
ncbi:MAG: ribonuclease HII [Pseudomonadota bacterium]|nr:ribonuclease HII [Pseudomonadota bacterium]